MNKVLDKNGIVLYNGDVLDSKLKEKVDKVDLVVTSPPYNLDVDYFPYEEYEDWMPYANYQIFTSSYLEKLYNMLDTSGRLCLNVPLDTTKGGPKPIAADVINIAQEVGFKYHSTIIWNKQFTRRKTSWGSWLSASAPYVIAPVETIIVLYKEQWKRTEKGVSDIAREDFMEWTEGLWTFSGQNKKAAGGHPAPFPIELPHRCIKLFSYVGDTVLDPFVGSGTTAIASFLNNRKCIGIDINEDFLNIAKSRLINDYYINNGQLEVS